MHTTTGGGMRLSVLARNVGVIVLGTSLVGCTSWRVQDVPPGELFQHKAPSRLQVSRGDSSKVVIDHPQLVGDSLIGESHKKPVAVPLAEVQSVAVRKGDTGNTVGLIVGVTGALFILSAIAMEDCCGGSFSLGE
jgi:hypothetical protein